MGSNLFEGDPLGVAEDDPRIDPELWAKIRDDPGEGKRNEHDLSWANSLRNRKLKAGEVFYLLLHHSRAKRPGHFEDYCRRTTATAFENEGPTAGESKGEPTGESKEDKEFEREYRRQKLYRAVIRKLDEEEAQSQVFELPPSYSSLAEEFLLPREPVRHAVESLLTQGGNASLTAKYKTGKTTLAINLGAALADEEPFLGRFDCELGEGRKVGIFNYELPKEQFREWLRCLGIKRPERIAVQHLRGVRAYLDDQSVAEQMVIWLSDHSVGFWIIDNRRRAMSGLENSNDAMNGLTEAIDWIKEQAGVTNSLTLAHMGRREHEEGEEYARGATAFDDWVDARWIETKKSKTRYLFAEGRDVDLPESRLAYDPSTRRLAIVGGGRSEEIREQVLKMVKEKPGYYVKEWLCDRIRGRKQTIGTVVDECIEDGEIEKDAKGKLWPSGFEPIKVRMAKR